MPPIPIENATKKIEIPIKARKVPIEFYIEIPKDTISQLITVTGRVRNSKYLLPNLSINDIDTIAKTILIVENGMFKSTAACLSVYPSMCIPAFMRMSGP